MNKQTKKPIEKSLPTRLSARPVRKKLLSDIRRIAPTKPLIKKLRVSLNWLASMQKMIKKDWKECQQGIENTLAILKEEEEDYIAGNSSQLLALQYWVFCQSYQTESYILEELNRVSRQLRVISHNLSGVMHWLKSDCWREYDKPTLKTALRSAKEAIYTIELEIEGVIADLVRLDLNDLLFNLDRFSSAHATIETIINAVQNNRECHIELDPEIINEAIELLEIARCAENN